MQSITVPESEAGRRLDKYLMKYLDAAPKSFIYKAFRKKNIKISGKRADGSEFIAAGDIIELFFSDETIASLRSSGSQAAVKGELSGERHTEAENATKEKKLSCKRLSDSRTDRSRGEAERKAAAVRAAASAGDKKALESYCAIVYEDKQVIIADKRAGVLSQKAAQSDHSLNEALLDYCGGREAASAFTPSVCNRIDRNTTGIVCFAKTYGAARELSRIFRDRELEKYYIAVVWGHIERAAHISAWLKKDEKSNRVMVSDSEVKGWDHIETAFKPVDSPDASELCIDAAYGRICNEEYTVLKVELITGKSHQIRAHLASIGHALLGDQKYGNIGLNRRLKQEYGINAQLLHAWEIVMPISLNEPLSGLSDRTFRTASPVSIKKLRHKS